MGSWRRRKAHLTARNPAKAPRAREAMGKATGQEARRPSKAAATVDVRETAQLSAWDMPVTLDKAIHHAALGKLLRCHPQGHSTQVHRRIGVRHCGHCSRCQWAIAAKKMLTFEPKDFVV